MRQLPSRYAFDAGQNLPDKEFRYLRTIIVIADVHWRFGEKLSPSSLTFQHWSGVSPYTSPCGFAETCVFGKQSLGKLSLRPDLRRARHIANLRLAFLPSSLTKVLPFTLGYSPNPPVSVFGTDTILLALEAFPGTLLHFVPPREREVPNISWAISHGFSCKTPSKHLRQSNRTQSVLEYVTPSNNIAVPEY